MKVLVINGPNLNMLGIRETSVYGTGTYDELVSFVKEAAAARGLAVDFFQSNHEGALIDEIQRGYYDGYDGIIINPAAYTHTSIGILDAVKAVGLPTVEVHISDVAAREDFRQVSYVREACMGTVMGKGFDGYVEAMDLLISHIIFTK